QLCHMNALLLQFLGLRIDERIQPENLRIASSRNHGILLRGSLRAITLQPFELPESRLINIGVSGEVSHVLNTSRRFKCALMDAGIQINIILDDVVYVMMFFYQLTSTPRDINPPIPINYQVSKHILHRTRISCSHRNIAAIHL